MACSQLFAIDQVVPVRNDVVDRATVVAERNTTIHAAGTLLLGFVNGQGRHELACSVLRRCSATGLSYVSLTRSNSIKPVGFTHYV
jgi:hypothetical protein